METVSPGLPPLTETEVEDTVVVEPLTVTS